MIKKLEDVAHYSKIACGELSQIENAIDPNSADGIAKLNEELKKLNGQAKTEISIDWENNDAQYYTNRIIEIKDSLKALAREDGTIDITTPGAQEAINILEALYQKEWECSNINIRTRIDISQLNSDTQQAVTDYATIQDMAASLQRTIDTKVAMGISIEGDEEVQSAKEALEETVNAFANAHPTATAELKEEGIDLVNAGIDTILNKITTVDSTPAWVRFGVEEEEVKNYTEEEKDGKGTVTWGNDTKLVDQYSAELKHSVGEVTWSNNLTGYTAPEFRATGTVNWSNSGSGWGQVNGTANAQGNTTLLQKGMAFAQGTWGAVKSGMSLVGELGQEIIVRGNRFFTVGDNGAEMVKIHKNDIIFNHKVILWSYMVTCMKKFI